MKRQKTGFMFERRRKQHSEMKGRPMSGIGLLQEENKINYWLMVNKWLGWVKNQALTTCFDWVTSVYLNRPMPFQFFRHRLLQHMWKDKEVVATYF